MDCRKMYEENLDFKKYVDTYAAKHKISVQTALEHLIVRNVAAMYEGK